MTHGPTARFRLLLLVTGLTVCFATGVRAQPQHGPEPVLDALRTVFSQEGLTLGTLFQAVVDPALDGDDGDPASVQLAAARVLLSGSLDGGFDYFLQTNFAGAPAVLDARVGWESENGIGVWAGRFKSPFSRELLTFAGSIDFVNRSRVVDALAPGRQLGVQLRGALGSRARWSAGGFTGPDSSPANESLVGVGRVEVTPELRRDDSELAIAVAAALGRDEAVAGRVLGPGYEGDGTVLGLDVRFTSGRLLVAGELIRGDFDPIGAPSEDASGLYLTGGWMTGDRSQLLLRWDRYRATDLDADDALVFGLNVWPTSASEIQVNWVAPLAGSALPHKVLVNFQVGF